MTPSFRSCKGMIGKIEVEYISDNPEDSKIGHDCDTSIAAGSRS
jgi:hypothetical protein